MRPTELERVFDTAVIICTPLITAESFDEATKGVPAIVLVGYATGTTPDRLNPVIAQRASMGIPVFIVSDNSGENHGILHIAYGTQANSSAAGAIPIEKVNVNGLDLVLNAIQDGLDAGKSGQELAEAVRQKFRYGPDEPKPLAAWDTSEGVDEQEVIFRQTLKRQGLNRIQIDASIQHWRFGIGTIEELRTLLQSEGGIF